MSLSATIRGLETLLKTMPHAGRIIEEEIEDAMTAELGDIVTDLADYPAERSGQTYERTGDLGRGWKQSDVKFVAQGGGIGARITNPVAYAHWVQDADTQARWHRGRWPTVQDVLADHQGDIDKAGQHAMERTADRLAGGG